MSQFKADEKFRNQRFTKIKSDKLDNLTYRSILEGVEGPSKKFTMGGRGASDITSMRILTLRIRVLVQVESVNARHPSACRGS